eukprot:gene15855-21484_t
MRSICKATLFIALFTMGNSLIHNIGQYKLKRMVENSLSSTYRMPVRYATIERDVTTFTTPLHPQPFEDSSTASSAADALQLNNIIKALPEKVFQKSLLKSVFYMIFDYAMWGGSFLAIFSLVNSPFWGQMAFWQQALASLTYWNISGFFMWCIFVVGHDCGHTTFSDNKLVNDVCGHITHGSLLVPFYTWQLTHRRHHMFHNHVDKDYSYMWFTPDKEQLPEFKFHGLFEKAPILKFLLPFYGWPLYLFGSPDGNHFLPVSDEQRMWKGTPKVEKRKSLISAAVVASFATAIYFACGQNLMNMLFYYIAPNIIFGWWLVCVTYLQHHSPTTVVYDEKDWQYVESAFETVDRKFGFGIDTLSHHITDGHVIHHLFFTKIPHYNLKEATKALKTYLSNNNLIKLYKYEETLDFPIKLHKYLVDVGFKATRALSRFNTPFLNEDKTIELKQDFS